jgi:hypothetical protein
MQCIVYYSTVVARAYLTDSQTHKNMKVVVAILFLSGSAAAFAPLQQQSRVQVQMNAAMDDLKTIAEKSNPILKVRERE